jgi:glucose-6-phosphate dehydrogenase assembly protein OpcA
MAERHPSRTIILIPEPEEPDGLDAELSMRSFETGDRHVCTEVIELRLRGDRAPAPASIVLPLLISDVPVFCRWRGEPPFGESPWEQLVGVVDRMIVDSSEWGELRYRELSESFEHTAVSDLVWARLHPWRVELAERWPAIAEQEIRISGPPAEATLLRAWLGTRLHRAIRAIAEGDELSVSLGGEVLSGPAGPPLTPSDLLSAELDRLSRDPVYEAAVIASL